MPVHLRASNAWFCTRACLAATCARVGVRHRTLLECALHAIREIECTRPVRMVLVCMQARVHVCLNIMGGCVCFSNYDDQAQASAVIAINTFHADLRSLTQVVCFCVLVCVYLCVCMCGRLEAMAHATLMFYIPINVTVWCGRKNVFIHNSFPCTDKQRQQSPPPHRSVIIAVVWCKHSPMFPHWWLLLHMLTSTSMWMWLAINAPNFNYIWAYTICIHARGISIAQRENRAHHRNH